MFIQDSRLTHYDGLAITSRRQLCAPRLRPSMPNGHNHSFLEDLGYGCPQSQGGTTKGRGRTPPPPPTWHVYSHILMSYRQITQITSRRQLCAPRLRPTMPNGHNRSFPEGLPFQGGTKKGRGRTNPNLQHGMYCICRPPGDSVVRSLPFSVPP